MITYHNMLSRFIGIVLLASVLTFTTATAQFSIAPNAFVIEAPSRSTEMFVKMSPDAATMEFELSSYFAVPGTDSLGNFKLYLVDSLSHRSAAPYLRFSPRRFILNAGEHQLVRISITSDSLPDGEYWSRIVASARLVSEARQPDELAMSAEMGLEIRTVSGFLYRKGAMHMEIDIAKHRAYSRNDSVFIDLDIRKPSTAAWLGTANIEILHHGGEIARRVSIPANAYISNTYRFVVPEMPLAPGQYVARVTLESLRDDPLIPLLKAPSVTSSAAFSINIGKSG
jgi:hypothetical protein